MENNKKTIIVILLIVVAIAMMNSKQDLKTSGESVKVVNGHIQVTVPLSNPSTSIVTYLLEAQVYDENKKQSALPSSGATCDNSCPFNVHKTITLNPQSSEQVSINIPVSGTMPNGKYHVKLVSVDSCCNSNFGTCEVAGPYGWGQWITSTPVVVGSGLNTPSDLCQSTFCGDGTCNGAETTGSCPIDCGDTNGCINECTLGQTKCYTNQYSENGVIDCAFIDGCYKWRTNSMVGCGTAGCENGACKTLPDCSTSWSPAVTTVCSGTAFLQTSNCGKTRGAIGTKNCGQCVADNSCAASTCTGSTCTDSCGNIYQGTKVCTPGQCTTSNACATSTCNDKTCTDSCGNSYQGTKDCSSDKIDWNKYLPWGIGFIVLIVGISMMGRKKR